MLSILKKGERTLLEMMDIIYGIDCGDGFIDAYLSAKLSSCEH